MGLFEPKTKQPEEEKTDALRDDIRVLTATVAELRGESEHLRDVAALNEEIDTLRRKATDAKIALDREREAAARTEREIEHKLGLHRQKVTQETELATERARLEVRAENLDADRDRFKQQIEDQRTSMESEMESTRDLMGKVLERMPKFETIRHENLQLGAAGNGGNGGAE